MSREMLTAVVLILFAVVGYLVLADHLGTKREQATREIVRSETPPAACPSNVVCVWTTKTGGWTFGPCESGRFDSAHKPPLEPPRPPPPPEP